MTMTRGAVVTLAAVALGAGIFVSPAAAVKPCNPNVCSEEISSACGAFTDAEFRACRKSVLENCRTSPDCSCTDPSLPACTACGDGIREVGEQCDGGAYCTATCT